MKRYLSLLLCLLLVLGMAPIALAEETASPVGAVEENVYTNEVFGFKMTLPDTWHFLSDEGLADRMGYDRAYASREGLAALLERDSYVCVMYCEGKDDSSMNANLMIQDLGAYDYISEQTFFEMTKDSFGEALKPQGFTNIQVTETTFELADREHVGAVLTADIGALEMYMVIVVVKADRYMGLLTVGSLDREKTEAVLGFFEPVEGAEAVLSASSGQTYENAALGIRAEFGQGWRLLNEEERAQQMGLVTETAPDEDMSKIIAESLESGKSVSDLHAERLDGSGDNVNIMLENMGALGLLVDEKTYYESARAGMEQYLQGMGCKIVSMEGQEVDFCGKPHYGMFLEASVNGVSFYERQVYIKYGSYMGILTAFSMDKTRLDDMIDVFLPYAQLSDGTDAAEMIPENQN